NRIAPCFFDRAGALHGAPGLKQQTATLVRGRNKTGTDMTTLTTIASTVTASFLGSFVEVVEAFTIILAVGVTRSWRPAFIGTGLALIVLAVLVLALGPLLGLIPLDIMQLVIGTLLILFGLRWLRKAILRASGFIALHDEEKAFAAETDSLKRQSAER